MKSSNTDQITVFSIFLAIVVITLPMVIYPIETGELIRDIYQNIVDLLGPTYMVFGILTLVFILYIALSKYGNFRLGGQDTTPEYSNFSWVCMLFCSGIGGGILYWSVVEWAYYVDESLFGIQPFSERAFHLASGYGIFHWGITGWALYCFPAIAIAVPFYHFKLGSLRLSSGLRTNSESSVETSFFGRLVDFVFVFVLIGASGGSMGMYVPIVAAGVSEIFNIEHTLMLDLSMLALCTSLFAYSVYKGIYKGIRVISNANILMSLLFLIAVLSFGPAYEILTLTFNALKEISINFIGMNTLGIMEESKFAEDWTVFYWAWWLALGPQVGLFVARVSKGRTLREVIIGMLLLGSFGCFLFFAIIGNYAITLELSGQLIVSEILANEGHTVAATKTILTLPYGELFVFAYCLIVVIFIATSYDSVSYLLSSHVKKISNDDFRPSRYSRLFWAFILSILPACLFFINSNRAAMDVILIMSPPLLVIFPIFAGSLVRTLKKHYD